MILLEFTMTGTKHSSGYKALKDSITEGDVLEFELDINNVYDRDAIKLLHSGQQIGWVPKALGPAKSMLARLIDHAENELSALDITARVVMHEPSNPVDMQLQVAVEFTEDF